MDQENSFIFLKNLFCLQRLQKIALDIGDAPSLQDLVVFWKIREEIGKNDSLQAFNIRSTIAKFFIPRDFSQNLKQFFAKIDLLFVYTVLRSHTIPCMRYFYQPLPWPINYCKRNLMLLFSENQTSDPLDITQLISSFPSLQKLHICDYRELFSYDKNLPISLPLLKSFQMSGAYLNDEKIEGLLSCLANQPLLGLGLQELELHIANFPDQVFENLIRLNQKLEPGTLKRYCLMVSEFYIEKFFKPRKGENPEVYFMNSEHMKRFSESLRRLTALEQLKLILAFVTLKPVDYLANSIRQFRTSLKELSCHVKIMYREEEDGMRKPFDLSLEGFDELKALSFSLDERYFYLKEVGLFFERLLELRNLKTVTIRSKEDVIEGSVRENLNLRGFEICRDYTGEICLKKRS